MSANLYEITFVADTASAVQSVARLEAEMRTVSATAIAMNTALGQVAQGLGNLHGANTQVAAGLTVVQNNIGGTHSSLLNLSSAMQVFSMGSQVFMDVGEKINTARQRIQEMTEDAMKLRDTLREIANLQGKSGPDDTVAADVLKLGMASGMMPKDAVHFEEQFLGAIPGAKQKKDANGVPNITEKVAEDLKTEGARFGTRVGLNPKTAGLLTGIMGQYQKIPTVEAGAQIMGRIAYGLNEGVGNMDPLARTLLGTAGSLVGENGMPMESLEELAVMEGVASTHANPYATGTRLRQAVRALRATKGPEAEWLAQHGVKDGMSHRDRLKAIKPAIMAEAKATGKGVDQVLKMHVTNDDTEARSLAEQLGDTELMDQRMAKMQTISGRETMDANSKYFAHDRNGIKRQQDARKAGQEFLIGQANEQRVMAENNAEQTMRDNHEIGGPENSWKESLMDGFGLFPALGGMKYRDKKNWPTLRAT